MGIPVFARLKDEMAELEMHCNWKRFKKYKHLFLMQTAEGFIPKYDSITKENVTSIIREEIGLVFNEVLKDLAYLNVHRRKEAFLHFVEVVNQ